MHAGMVGDEDVHHVHPHHIMPVSCTTASDKKHLSVIDRKSFFMMLFLFYLCSFSKYDPFHVRIFETGFCFFFFKFQNQISMQRPMGSPGHCMTTDDFISFWNSSLHSWFFESLCKRQKSPLKGFPCCSVRVSLSGADLGPGEGWHWAECATQLTRLHSFYLKATSVPSSCPPSISLPASSHILLSAENRLAKLRSTDL